MNKSQCFGALALLSTIGFAAADAQAVIVVKTLPGISCHAVSGGALGEFGGTVNNLSATSELNVSCPLGRDGNLGSASLSAGSSIQVFDRNPTVASSCTLINEFGSGTTVFQIANTQSTPGGFFSSNITTLTYPALSGGDYYHAQCSIPRSSGGSVSHVVRFRLFDNE